MSDTTDPLDITDALGAFPNAIAALDTTFVPGGQAARSAAPRPLRLDAFDGAAYVRARLAFELAAESGEGVKLARADLQTLIYGLALGASSIAYNFAPPFLANDASKHAPFKSTSLGGASPDDRDGHYVVAPFGHILGSVDPNFRRVISMACKSVRRLVKETTTQPVPGAKYLVADSVTVNPTNANFAAAPVIPIVLGIAIIAGATVLGWKAIGESAETDREALHVQGDVAKKAVAAARAMEVAVVQMQLQAKAGQPIQPSPELVNVLKVAATNGEGETFFDRFLPAAIAVGAGAAIAAGLAMLNRRKNERKKDQKAA